MGSIEELVNRAHDRRASDGERQRAFVALVVAFQDTAYGYALALLGDRGWAEDATQEAFLTAYHHLDELREPAAFPGWLRRIVHTHCRRLTRLKQLPTASLDPTADPPGTSADPAGNLDRDELQRAVRAAIHSLPERERTVVLLFYLGHYSQTEIATFLDLPLTTVKKRLQYARERLRADWLRDVSSALSSLRPSNGPSFVRRLRLALLGDALAAEAQRGVGEFLRVEGIDERTGDATLRSLRHAVTQAGYQALLELLLLDGVDRDDLDADGYTPLSWAARHGDAETVSLLLHHRAERNCARDAEGSG